MINWTKKELNGGLNIIENEISFPLDLNHHYFNPAKYLDSIKQLVLLYGHQPLK